MISMKKKFLYILTALLAVSFTACKDDDTMMGVNPVEDLDRMPMTMFRTLENTNKEDGNDAYHSGVVTEVLNQVHLSWFGIEGAAGYEIRYGLQSNLTDGEEATWADDSKILEDIVLGPDVLDYDIYGLEYATAYRFAIRVLSPKGEGYHSKWYGHGNGREWAEQAGFTTEERYLTPGIINCGEKDYTEFTVYLKPQYNANEAANNNYDAHFDVVTDANGQEIYKIDYLEVKVSPINPTATVDSKWEKYYITQDDIDNGEVRVTGLTPNSVYVINVVNEGKIIPVVNTGDVVVQNRGLVDVDAIYNTCTYRTKGDPGLPILIKHKTNPNDSADIANGAVGGKYNACRIDTIINNYNADVTMAEGQVFYLEGDKEYYFYGNNNISKGFTLETLPSDVAQGKRAKVYLGGMIKNGTSVASNNFMLGRTKGAGEADAPIEVEDLIFRSIDFDCPLAQNCGYEDGATGNYFINMHSAGMAVTFSSIQCIDCTFQHMIRGFIRVQGSKVKKFRKLVVDGCVFYNCGYYQNNGNSYCMFAGDGASAESNIYEDVQFVNNTIYNSPLNSIFTDNNKDLTWQDYGNKWKFNVSHNTFINFNTFASSRYVFSLRYVPGGSEFYVHDNLFVLTRADNDEARNLNCSGSDIRQINGDGSARFDFGDNYSAGCLESHLKDDGIFSAASFSAAKNSFGAFPELCVNGAESLVIRVGENPLKAVDLFTSPNPPTMQPSTTLSTDNAAPASGDIWTALLYKTTSAVTSHEIYTKNIGDQRWKSSNPRAFYANPVEQEYVTINE